MNDMSPPRAAAAATEAPRNPRARGMAAAGPFGVLDIGTTKIVCLIGRTESDGTLRALGFGWQKGRGVRGGGIVDLDEAENAPSAPASARPRTWRTRGCARSRST